MTTPDLAAFLTARLDEQQAAAEHWLNVIGGVGIPFGADFDLADIDAKRRIIADYERALANRRAHQDDLAAAGALLALHGVIKSLALPYADHPAYDESWRV